MKKKKWKNNLDEMQEQKLLKIEHNGCWLAFWGLFIALLVQFVLYGGKGMHQMAGEWIEFMWLAIYLAAGCIRNGIFDRRLKPTHKVCVIAALIAGSVVFVVQFLLIYRNYPDYPLGAAAGGLFTGIFTFTITLILMEITTALTKRRQEALEKEDEEE